MAQQVGIHGEIRVQETNSVHPIACLSQRALHVQVSFSQHVCTCDLVYCVRKITLLDMHLR
jgi:hypothetical protein